MDREPGWRQSDRGDDAGAIDEGGLRAPPGLSGWRKAWWWFDFIVLVKLARLRFVAVLVAIGLIITQWDTLAAHYERWTRPAITEQPGGKDTEYFCPMHPTVVRDNNREKCPICFMPLSKRKKGRPDEPLPAGAISRVQLSPYRVVLAGAQTWNVDYLPLTKQIDAIGYVEFNERGLTQVAARVKGRIDALYANETGQIVEIGDDLAMVYSPDVLVTVENLLLGKKNAGRNYLADARERLRLWGIDEAQIDELANASQPATHFKIRSPTSGHIIKKYVQQGQYVEEGSPLYDLADLSTVWIQAQVYEDDLALLPLDQAHKSSPSADGAIQVADEIRVTATTRSFPNEPFHGELAFIYPHVDQDTRTVTIRTELQNPGHKLRPGITATVSISVRPQNVPSLLAAAHEGRLDLDQLMQGAALAVPESAIIDTGAQVVVYRQASPGVFLGLTVELGPRMTGPDGVRYYPVLSGLSQGDKVVTAGSFLVDAETRLNPAAGSIYFGGSGGQSAQSATDSVVRPSTPKDPDAKAMQALADLPAADRELALAQRFCAVLPESRLGSMGPPIKLMLQGEPVFICCEGCKSRAEGQPEKALKAIARLKQQAENSSPAPEKALNAGEAP